MQEKIPFPTAREINGRLYFVERELEILQMCARGAAFAADRRAGKIHPCEGSGGAIRDQPQNDRAPHRRSRRG